MSISDAVECPYELDGHNPSRQLEAVCDWEQREEKPYFEKVEAWNRKKGKGTREDFLKHLLL